MKNVAPLQFLGKYQIVERVGAGGFSEVWKGLHPETGDFFAIKVPIVETFIDHLRTEARVGGLIKDQQIPEILEINLEHDPPFLVLPWVGGEDLQLPESPPSPAEFLGHLKTFRELVEVVGRLHKQNIIHGDIKPGNVRIGNHGTVYLLDLGLARVEMTARREGTLAQSLVSVDGRSIAGTLDYMAPEILDGADPHTASDVYSLGVMLHTWATGKAPAFGINPEVVNPYLPPGFSRFIRKVLHLNPDRRVSQATELVTQLDEFIATEESCLARKNGHERRRVYQARMATLQRGLKTLVIASCVLLVFFGIGAMTISAIEAQQNIVVVLTAGSFLIIYGILAMVVPFLLAVSTINAWIAGVPDKTYKEREGHPLWSFMMQ